MCCILLLAAGIGPRLAFGLVWIFGDRVDMAYDTWVWPLLGLFYALAWGPIEGVSGAGWIFVALGVALDLATYLVRFARRSPARSQPV